MVTGEVRWYASVCRECPAGCGILAKAREGRAVKIEGNPYHPVNRGAICMRGQAALQGLYNPDRLMAPKIKGHDGTFKDISFEMAKGILQKKVKGAAGKAEGGIRMVTETTGETLYELFSDALGRSGALKPLVLEPFAYESLRAAHKAAFGDEALISYRMEGADFLLCFGADFLETWLSPVEYSRKFAAMHGLEEKRKGRFFHVSPVQTLTAANADLWLGCRPDTEAAVAMGLIKAALDWGRGEHLFDELKHGLSRATAAYTPEKVSEETGIAVEDFNRLSNGLLESRWPLVLPTGSANEGPNAVKADIASILLNYILNPTLSLFDFTGPQRVTTAAPRAEADQFFDTLSGRPPELLLIYNANPVYGFPPARGVEAVKAMLEKDAPFVVAFSNFMDETAAVADLIFPTRLPLEMWDEYGGKEGIYATLQPATGLLAPVPHIGDLFLEVFYSAENRPAADYKSLLMRSGMEKAGVRSEREWLMDVIRVGGSFKEKEPVKANAPQVNPDVPAMLSGPVSDSLSDYGNGAASGETRRETLAFLALPSIRFFDGRGGNRPWLCEIPDPMTKVAWNTPAILHPETAAAYKLAQEDLVEIESEWGKLHAPVYITAGIQPGVIAMPMGQGHWGYGRYADQMGTNPLILMPPHTNPESGGPICAAPVTMVKRGRRERLANTDGSRSQHGRTIALTTSIEEVTAHDANHPVKHGLTMHDAPIWMPTPEGYDKHKDFYPAHEHDGYRWAMTVDLDRCIGCGACAAACYAENNVGTVGIERMLEGREMSWLAIQRYMDDDHPERVIFLPMLCQHCDNAPCESVCPVYAPHHSKEGLNNQIYNRCIGTRFCSQNCPYKVRRFNWFSWQWPEPLNLQLNPDVTVRGKGVMEKCSFCIQRIKGAHGIAKNENRKIRDGEVVPACMQTCPTGVFTFGNLLDEKSRVRKMVEDQRAYQILSYLNTKPAVFYLKKVTQHI